ncbi:TBC1 domain family member 1 isoform X5 [Indicator indicator]|uniref:TBC1 domain family member 1 isoform X5 n=1 Tax=Indicator indicator TaxID=1002788 RepID=UPI0023DFA2A4|nr:TBC1 domain family member 1 isoform X5 [Indicator indicator]
MEPITFKVKKSPTPSEFSASFSLQLVGSLPVHSLTTMSMLPWIVAEIRTLSTKSSKEEPGTSQVRLYVTPASLRCEPDTGQVQQWDPLIYPGLFEYKPQHVHKLIHNSHDPSYFACLIKDGAANQQSICYVFKADDQTKVPEIISSIRQAGKIARQEEFQNNLSDVEDPFAKKFEVLFCGRVTVAHKNAPPALIDECIEKFNRASCTKKTDSSSSSQQHETPLVSEEEEKRPMRKSYSQPGLRSFAFKKDLQEAGQRSNSFVRSFEEDAVSLNLKSQLVYGHSVVQPTDMAENRTMLFTIGQSEVYLISPDTKKVAIEKSFKEISFCSQGIRHVDHFGFICRESSENGGFHFVCYVFQCTDEALVDEIMMTLKQAFTVAAVQQTSKAQPQLCEGCPMQNLHKLCEKIEGLHPSKTKLELQKHLTTLNNQEQASVFEEVKKLRPRNDQKENELVMSVLRNMYEEKQKDHVHVAERKQASQPPAENTVNEVPSSAPRFRLDMLKNKAKRSLTESFESILSRGSKARGPLDNSAPGDLDNTVSSTSGRISKGPPACEKEKDRLPTLPTESSVKSSGSVDDLSSNTDDSPLEQSVMVPQQSFRRRANTLSHLPTESQEPLVPVETSPSVPQRKLMRYHSVSTETPHKRNYLPSPVGESKSSSGQLARSPTLARLNPSASSPNFFKYLRHNSSGEPSGHFAQKSISYRTALRKKLHSSSSVPNFLKFLAPVDENNTSDFRNTTSDYESKHSQQTGGDSPVRTRRHSWRQQIFLRVATPQKACDSPSRYDDYSELGELPPRSPLEPVCEDGPFGPVKEERKRTPRELRELWKKAIIQQILLLRMEKENQKLQASENNLQNRRLKLDYEEITPCLKDVTLIWEKMLSAPGRSKTKFDVEKIHSAVGQGVPRHHRGEIWKFLAEQYHLKHQFPSKQPPKDTPYKELLKQLTSQQHAILIDLGRTFPTHPYFSAQLGAGQLSLYNILKAYSLLDQEVGYCQGLSFVAGVLLLHMSEEDAFKMLKFLMFDMGLRKQYRPDMTILQMEKTISQVFEMDIAKQLQAYEVEYHVLQDELIDSSLNDNQRLDKLEKANSSLRKQNFDLLEELQVANGKIQNLEATVELLLSNEGKLKQSILTLEQERAALLKAVEEMQKKIGDTDGKPLLTRQEHMDAD